MSIGAHKPTHKRTMCATIFIKYIQSSYTHTHTHMYMHIPEHPLEFSGGRKSGVNQRKRVCQSSSVSCSRSSRVFHAPQSFSSAVCERGRKNERHIVARNNVASTRNTKQCRDETMSGRNNVPSTRVGRKWFQATICLAHTLSVSTSSSFSLLTPYPHRARAHPLHHTLLPIF